MLKLPPIFKKRLDNICSEDLYESVKKGHERHIMNSHSKKLSLSTQQKVERKAF